MNVIRDSDQTGILERGAWHALLLQRAWFRLLDSIHGPSRNCPGWTGCPLRGNFESQDWTIQELIEETAKI